MITHSIIAQRLLAFTALSILTAAGCVNPMHDLRHVGSLRHHVNVEMLARTDNSLAPRCGGHTIPDFVVWEDGLSEEEATAVGIWNHPAYQALLADLSIARADVIEAAQIRNPSVVTMLPAGPKQWELALNVPLDVIWLRPTRVAAAQLESRRVAERLVQDGLNVMRDVRVAHIDWQIAARRAEIGQEILTLRTEVGRIAEARLKAGESAELEVSAVRLDAAVGQAELQRFVRDAELARERMRYLLGMQSNDLALWPEPANPISLGPIDVDELVAEAIVSRPDLRAIRLATRAAQQRASLARRDIWGLTGMLPDLNSRGSRGFEAGPGFTFNVPIFHQNQGAITRACAQAEQLQRQYNDQQGLVSLEVRQAFLQWKQAQQEWQLWRDHVVPQATEAVNSTQETLQEDAISLLLVLETTRQWLNARQGELDAEAQLCRAIAELERSVGRRLANYTGGGMIEQDQYFDAIPHET